LSEALCVASVAIIVGTTVVDVMKDTDAVIITVAVTATDSDSDSNE